MYIHTYKSKPYLNNDTMLTLYNSFIYPYFSYCIPVWGNTFTTYLNSIYKLQKRAVRMIVGANRLAHTEPIFRELKIMKLNELYVYAVQLMLYKYHHSELPEIFDDFFIRNNAVHSHNTRQQYGLHVLFVRTNQASSILE